MPFSSYEEETGAVAVWYVDMIAAYQITELQVSICCWQLLYWHPNGSTVG